MEEKLYNEYLVWLKETHDLTPEQQYGGLNLISELVSLRNECLGLMGETPLVKIMREGGTFEKTKKEIEDKKLTILTFDEFKNSIHKQI